MEIIGIDRGKMRVIINDKSLIVTGELTTTPIFYADINSIKNWEASFENVKISMEERDEIIIKIIEQAKDAEIKIVFD